MGRNFTRWYGWLVLLGLALEPAQGGDPKSAARHREAAHEMVVSRVPSPVPLRYDVFGSSAVRPFEVKHSLSADKSSTHEKEKENGTHGVAERKPVTLFRFTSKLGEVAVQPVIGPFKGAQFSLGF